MNRTRLFFCTWILTACALFSGCNSDERSNATGGKTQTINLTDTNPHDTTPQAQNKIETVLGNTDALRHLRFPTTALTQQQNPIETAYRPTLHNVEAVIPPQCYTKHEKQFNPCMTCHQTYPNGARPNVMNDGDLQREYAFSDIGVTNHWSNLFEDKLERMKAISDQDVIDYIHTDNYSPLIDLLKKDPNWKGPVPAIANLQLGADAFDAQGFAKDGSHWVAFNYKPFPSTFWPTNGSTDDVIVRLPEAFRTNSACEAAGKGYSHDTYIANLTIMELAVKDMDATTAPTIDEQRVCHDLNGDGVLSTTTRVVKQDHYVGDASAVQTNKMLYPKGVEFIHSVRYVGVNPEGKIVVPPRMKELRYMQKTNFYSPASLASKYGNEQQEKTDENLPTYDVDTVTGTSNQFGWKLHGFIEDASGSLRLQNNEEALFCMGCHTSIGATIDQTFAFPRKLDGAQGWGYINLENMKDAPNWGKMDGEILHYLRTVGGGDEFRANTEMLDKWFNADGTVRTEKVQAANVYELITPSAERALELNKAYMTIVHEQDFIHGRDANFGAIQNVYEEVDGQTAPVLPEDKTQTFDMRLQW